MARGGGARAGRGGRSQDRRPHRPDAAPRRPARQPSPSPGPSSAPVFASSGRFVLGAVPGATPGRWIDTWRERFPDVPFELREITVRDQRAALDGGGLDAALIRLPLDRAGLSVIPLYDEQPVVVTSVDSHLTAAESLSFADLEGEVLIVPADDVLGIPPITGTVAPAFDAPASTGDAIGIVATGVGVVIVPLSIARLHQRRDVASRTLVGGPVSSVALAWPSGATTPAVEAFVGIVRGRTAQSSRG